MRSGVVTAVLGLGLVSVPSVAAANSGGVQAGSCNGCHGDGNHVVSVATTPATIAPGDTVTVALTVEGPGAVAGVFVGLDGGSIDPLPGQGLASVGNGLTHAGPRPMSGGEVTFRFSWDVPGAPGATRFAVSSVLANGNGTSGGDSGSENTVDLVYGCGPQEFFRDNDGDGFGRADESRVFCAGDPPQGYATTGDDCDDNREMTYPGAIEICNLIDDDCDDVVDDDAIPVEQYPDADSDGYYSPAERESGESFVGCVPTEGWAAEPGDCAPNDAARNPGAEEVCNLLDDNCDGRADERVRPICGEGWCRRESSTCEAAACVPGQPIEEVCNLLDDDCDGVVDDNAPCEDGLVCLAGLCREPDEPPSGSESGSDDGSQGATTESDPESSSSSETGASASNSDSGCKVGGGPTWMLMVVVLGAWTRRRSTSSG